MHKLHSYRYTLAVCGLALLLLALAAACLLVGSVDIDAGAVLSILSGHGSGNEAWDVIVVQSRVPTIATAALAGAALSVSGLLLQTTFNNPLAGPSILGVSTGAGLGVAIVMLAMGGTMGGLLGETAAGYVATLVGALLGAGAVLALLVAFSAVVHSDTMLLIIGILVKGVHSYVTWGFGNFSGVALSQLPVYASVVLAGLAASMLMVKPLNAMLLGARYAQNLGVNTHRVRIELLLITGVLTAVVTAFCGPIGFLGLVVPHLARLMLSTSNHSRLLPVTILAGADTALLCALLSTGFGHVIPLNAITPIIGVPVIIYILLNRRKIQYFN